MSSIVLSNSRFVASIRLCSNVGRDVLIDLLGSLLKRPGMEEDCEKCRTIREELYADVYDGKIWKQFGNWKGSMISLSLIYLDHLS